jgi:hypothetical protein
VEATAHNGIIGDLHNYASLDGAALLERMLGVARNDVQRLIDRSAEAN